MADRASACAAWLGALALVQCAAPTVVRVEVYSDLPCDVGSPAVVVLGASVAELGTKAPSSVSARCEAGPRGWSALGDVALAPAGADDAELALAVLQRVDGLAADDCARADLAPEVRARCVVARRQLRFVPHQTVPLRVDLRQICAGATCPAEHTCVRGACVPARVAGGACATCEDTGLGTAPVGAPGFAEATALFKASEPPYRLQAAGGSLFWIATAAGVDTRIYRLARGAHVLTIPAATSTAKIQDFAVVGDRLLLLTNASYCTILVRFPSQEWDAPSFSSTFLDPWGTPCPRVAATPGHAWVVASPGTAVDLVHAGVGLAAVGALEKVAAVRDPLLPLAASGASVYWFDGGAIVAAHPGPPVQRIATVAGVVDLVTDGQAVYWLTRGGIVQRASATQVDGPAQTIATGIRGGARLALDGANVYVTAVEQPTGIFAIDKAGGSPRQLWGGTPTTDSLTVDDDGVYWVEAGTAVIHMAAKRPGR